MNIREIEAMTREDIEREKLEGPISIKEHDIYFVDIQPYFGYSAIVFFKDRQIHYANDYELHHKYIVEEKGKDALREFYLKKYQNILFTDDELKSVKNYEDYQAKSRYLRDFYPQRAEHETIFCINPTEEETKAFRKKVKGWYYDDVAFAYFPDKAFVERHRKLYKGLEDAKNVFENSYDYLKEAYLSEMYNHEYGINLQGDYDVLSAFYDDVPYFEDSLMSYFKYLKMTDIQIKAYRDARNEYSKNAA